MNTAKGVVGLIGFKNGSITYARTQKENGENAIFKILAIQKGFFALENKSPSKNNINIRPVEVLMRHLKANDETKKNNFPKSAQILSLFLMFFVVGCNKEEALTLPENESDIKLRIHGSNTIGAHLMPTMVNAWLENLGATDISIDTLTNQVEKIISGDVDGNSIKVEIFSYGSSTGFSDLA